MVLSLLRRGFLLGLLVLFSLSVNARPVILTIDANSNDGTQIGIAIGTKLKAIFPHLPQQYDAYLAFLLSPSQFAPLLIQAESLKTKLAPQYQAEVDAIAAVWQLNALDQLGDGKLSLNEFWLLQFLADLTPVDKGVGFAALNHQQQNPIVARNVDWKSTADLRSLQTISVYHYGERTIVTVGFAGLVGAINGFNEAGLFISLSDASTRQYADPAFLQNASSFDLRNVLENENKVTAASQMLAQKIYPRSHQFLLADPETVAILEQASGETGKLRKATSPLVNEMIGNQPKLLTMVNCFALQASPRNCYTTTDYYRWSRLSGLLKSWLNDTASVSEVIALMQDQANRQQAIFNQDTLQTLVFTPKDRVLYLYTQPVHPSAETVPLLEKYQFIQINHSPIQKFIDVALLALGVGVLIAAWFYIFRSDKKYKLPLLRK